MRRTLLAPGRAFHRPLPCALWSASATVAPYAYPSPSASAHAPRPCRLRCSSTLRPTNIAALLATTSHPRPQQPGQTLTLNGWVHTVRKQKRVAFAAIGDGSSMRTVQLVLSPEQADGLSTGTAVAATGRWTPSPGHEQSHELHVDSLRVLGQNDAAKYHTPEFLRTLPHLRSRLPFQSLLLRLRSQVTAQTTNYFAQHDFTQTHPPIITSSDCEGAGDVFVVSTQPSAPAVHTPTQSPDCEDMFFQTPKYLTVSSQLHLEALAQSVGRVWALSPTFRAEKSDTPRHLSEFYMLEAELAFVTDLSDVMDVVEGLLRAIATGVKESPVGQELLQARAREHKEDGEAISETRLMRRWQGLMDGPWPRISYAEAMRHLKDAVDHGKAQFIFTPDDQEGFQTEHERFLAETVGRGGPIFVTDYPRRVKPFYMAPSAERSPGTGGVPTVACFDLLVPEICELVGGSMREHRLPELLKSMENQGLRHAPDVESETSDGSLQWYLDLRRYGSVPHGGFGLGFDRLLCYLSGAANIRDVVSFPRWHKRGLAENGALLELMPHSMYAFQLEPHRWVLSMHLGCEMYALTCVVNILVHFDRHSLYSTTIASSVFTSSIHSITALSANIFRVVGVAHVCRVGRARRQLSSAATSAGKRRNPDLVAQEHEQFGLPTLTSPFRPDACALKETVAGNTLNRTIRTHHCPEPIATLETVSPAAGGFMATHERTVAAAEDDEHDYESLPPNFSLSANMVAGAFAGIAEHSVMYPIDLLKTRMQVVNPSPSAIYSGISNAMITISRVEGFRTLWRGLSSVVLGAGPAHAVYFASYEAVKHALGGNQGGAQAHHPVAAAASGAAATIASDALMNPFDVVKQRMQLHGSIYRSVPQCAREVFRTEGLSAFYVSYPTTLCMTVPFTAMQFMAYESISKVMNPTGRYDPYTHCFAGGLAGGVAAGVTTPLDVIKTLLQTRGNATDPELRNVSGLWQAAKIIHRREGYGGYFRGLKPRIITTMPSTAICWSAYEMAKAFFIARNEAAKEA
ncbi:hypothetical protein BDV95DRAFT_555765 [Massariosphaeria phaeospora]|uniref:asparagine--tRNA ligase n=1 Tax=Massariosphaeria phaeospora TaxID=100035 RepID=A0A7C8M3J0_9PLEO|nr:hypothetical protein BDV95DRAFT_555765 [Massariosphaeria phaeospora]